MSTPHYESEYGDSYLESIRVEFDPGTVQILTGDISYSSLAKKRVIEASVRAQKERSAYLDELRSEESNLRDALSRMENWLDEIKRIEARPVCRDLDTYSNSLSTLSEIRQECDRLASLRQESIRQVQPVSIGWDRSTYIMQFIYSSEPFQNPILSDIGFIGKLLEEAEKEFGASNWP
jgi:septation ring formation regulator EzrA